MTNFYLPPLILSEVFAALAVQWRELQENQELYIAYVGVEWASGNDDRDRHNLP